MKILRFNNINEGRSEWTKLVVKIDDQIYDDREASMSFVKAINYISKLVGSSKFLDDYMASSMNTGSKKFISINPEEFKDYAKTATLKSASGDFFINTHSSTKDKREILIDMIERYQLRGNVDIVSRKLEPSKINKGIDNEQDIDSNEIDQEIDEEEDTDDRIRIRTEFWIQFLPLINNVTSKFIRNRVSQQRDLGAVSTAKNIFYGFLVSGSYVQIQLALWRSKDENKKIFDYLLSKKEEIEKSFGDNLTWERKDDKKGSVISYKKMHINAYDKTKWPEINLFFTDYFPKFEKVFDDLLKNLDSDVIKISDFGKTEENFENKGNYSDENLIQKLTLLLSTGRDDRGVERLSSQMRNAMTIFLKILLSDRKKFTREEIKNKLFQNSIGETEGQSGQILSYISQFLTKENSDFLRQIIKYDIIRWSSTSETDIGAKKDNYEIEEKYRDLVSRGLEKISDLTKTKESTPKEFKPLSNPFKQSYCVLGKSGFGKSQTVSDILELEGHEFIILIPTSLSVSLLGNYSSKGGGSIVTTRLANLILEAYENPSKLYTAIIDECHKPRTIEMVNDELLQAISKYRNNENRFLTLEGDVYDLMIDRISKLGIQSKDYLFRRNIRVPDNFGFIFLSSKPDVIVDNDDFYNRVEVINLPHYSMTGKEMKSIDDLLTFAVKDKSKFSEDTKNDN